MTSCVCPACGFSGDLVVFTNDAQARHFSRLMGQVPAEVGDALLRYLNLFSPAKHKLTWPRARRLLEELLPDIQRGAIERKRRHWLAPVPVWLRAFEHMHEQRPSLQLPLKSHGYLHEVIVGLVDKAETSAEKSTEQARRTDPRSRNARTDATHVGSQLPDADALREAQVRSLTSLIGGRIQDDAQRQRRPRTAADYADDYRDRYDPAVVDAAIKRLQPPVQQENS